MITLVNAQIRICQLPVTNVLDATELRTVTKLSGEMCRLRTKSPAMVKARAFVFRKTDVDGEKNA